MLSGKARAKARMLGHGRCWNVMDAMARAILGVLAPLHLEWPTGPAQTFAQTARAKAMAQLNSRAKVEERIPTRVKVKAGMQERATATAHLAARARARRASTAWTTRTGLENMISNGLESGPQPRQQQPRRQRCSHHSLG